MSIILSFLKWVKNENSSFIILDIHVKLKQDGLGNNVNPMSKILDNNRCVIPKTAMIGAVLFSFSYKRYGCNKIIMKPFAFFFSLFTMPSPTGYLLGFWWPFRALCGLFLLPKKPFSLGIKWMAPCHSSDLGLNVTFHRGFLWLPYLKCSVNVSCYYIY